MTGISKKWQRGLSSVLLAFILLTLFITPKASAWMTTGGEAGGAHFINAGEFQTFIAFVAADDTDSDGPLNADLMRRIGKDNDPATNDLQRGVATINSYVAQLLQNGNAIWRDTDTIDSTRQFELTGCNTSTLKKEGSGWKILDLYVTIPGEGCVDVISGHDLPMDMLNNPTAEQPLLIHFKWVNSRTIARIDGKEGSFIQVDPTNMATRFFRADEEGESDQDFLELQDQDTLYYHIDNRTPILSQIANPNNARDLPAEVGSDGNVIVPGAGGDLSDLELNCTWSINPLTWLMCPIVEGASKVATLLDKEINEQLSIQVQGSDSSLDSDSAAGKGTYGAWAAMRNIAIALLVLIALAMVISQAISVGPFDAYTVKKVLPRIFIAVIAIIFSWQLSKLLVQFTNDLGQGVGNLIARPFGASLENPDIDGTGVTLGSFGLSLAFLSGIDILVVLSLALTGLLAVLTAFLVITFRNIFLILLVITAPIAAIMWILPNTKKAWNFWQTNFTAVLLAFPIIIAIITTGRVFAAITSNADNADGSFFYQIVIFISYFGPYFAIPAAFRLAGGAIASLGGVVNDRSKGIFDSQRKYRAGRSSWRKELRSRPILQARAGAVRALRDRESGSSSRLAKFGMRSAGAVIGGYNIEQKASEKQAHVSKELNDQIATGRDESIRGLTVNKRAADNAAGDLNAADGNGLKRISDGKVQYKSLGGQWIDEAYVDEGQRRWGNDVTAQQAALSYEMRKAMTDDQVKGVATRYKSLAKEQWNMTDTEAAGAWIGSGFENQNQHLEFKNTSWTGALDNNKFATEAFEKKGSYQLSQMSAHTIKQLQNAYMADTDSYLGKDASGNPITMATATPAQVAAATAKRDDTRRKVQSVAETFMTRYGIGPGGVATVENGNVIPTTGVAGVAGAAGTPSYQTNSQGAGSVAEAVRELAVNVGIYRPLDPSTETHSALGPSQNPRHN